LEFDIFFINAVKRKEKISVIGASGQAGVELTFALRQLYDDAKVVASDLQEETFFIVLLGFKQILQEFFHPVKY
jgi:hypothetical protein